MCSQVFYVIDKAPVFISFSASKFLLVVVGGVVRKEKHSISDVQRLLNFLLEARV